MFENVRADIRSARDQNIGCDQWDQRVRVFFQPGTLAVLSYRFCHWVRSIRTPGLRHLAWFPVVIVRGFSQVLTGVHISSKARIGPGFVVHTVYGVFIPPVKIGKNCSVQTGVVIGYGVRCIGDDVVIGAGAKLVNPITIGNNVLIAPNSLVTTNVPDNMTVAGVPARISVGRLVSTSTVLGKRSVARINSVSADLGAPALEVTRQTS
jgi:serine O-acetyltransferase